MVWYKYCLLIVISVYVPYTGATPWPYINNPRIISCTPNSVDPCGLVEYASDGVVFADISPVGKPDPLGSLEIQAHGLHCDLGSSVTGVPFSSCVWVKGRANSRHRPTMVGKCRLANRDSWELTPDSTCYIGPWEAHNGAGPGGECVIFTQMTAKSTLTALLTPYGVLDPVTVANSGNRFCQKALPPAVRCDLEMPDSIDHGSLPTTGTGSVTVFGSVNCGNGPVVAIVGGGEIELGDGVKSRISASTVSANSVSLTSDLTVTDAAPGEYRGVIIVRVSPY